ncbi:MAG TPA: FG-GAP-like repeat-containing protein [Candidatus Acidoferrales bacterium]|nr:FG-GAP-like repeat-containing protein [Candidatus Acidoferrales bacterium]
MAGLGTSRLRRLLVAASVFLALSLLAPRISSAQQYVFNRGDFATGNQPSDVVIGDLNGDGRQDLVITNQADGTFSILSGQSNGTFGVIRNFPTGGSPTTIVVADLNGDGIPDIAFVDEKTKTVGIVIGIGGGNFHPPVTYKVGTEAVAIAVGDFDNDGKLDLAVLNENCVTTCGQSSVSILLGNGDGTFATSVSYTVGKGAVSIAAGDFSGNGNLDLAVANSTTKNISILAGKGDGTFSPAVNIAMSAAPSGVAAADFDGDKVLDLVVGFQASGGLAFLKGNGNGTFQAGVPFGAGITAGALQVADFNGDKNLDLAVVNQAAGGVSIFLGNGNGTFQAGATYATTGSSSALAAGDLNGDGILDLAVVNQQAATVSVLLGNGDGTFSPRQILPAVSSLSAESAVVGDFNGDGIPDLAIGEGDFNATGAGQVAVFPGQGGGILGTAVNSTTGGSPSAIVAADFNKDGKLDVAVANGNGAAVLLGNGDGSFGAPMQVLTTSGVPAKELVAGDVNNDGVPDLIVLSNATGDPKPIKVYLGNGDGTFSLAHQIGAGSSVPVAIAAADLNNDGKLDLVVALSPTGIEVLLGNGDGTFQSPVMYATDSLPSDVTIADLLGNGKLDIVVAAGKVDVYLGKGDGTFGGGAFYAAGTSPQKVAIGDFNADGKKDIAVTNQDGGGDIAILLGKGDGTFQSPVELADGAPTGAPLAVGDLNQDGTVDLAVAGGTGSVFMSEPIATVSPTQLSFGSVGINSPATLIAVLTNSGNGPLALASTSATSSYSAKSVCGASVNPGTSCNINVTFAPSAVGSSAGTLTLADNAKAGQQTVALTGTGAADYSLTVASGSSSSITVSDGIAATYNLDVNPLGGFNQTVSLTCSDTVPLSQCSITPPSALLDGTNSAGFAVKVTTTAPSFAPPRAPAEPGIGKRFLVVLGLFLMLMAMGASYSRRRPAYSRLAVSVGMLALTFTCFAAMTCCGGKSGSLGTPKQSFTLSVTASSTSGSTKIQHSMNLTLVVQ